MKQKRFFAMLLALCLMVSMVPNGVVAVEWSIPTIEKTIDTATYVNPLYDGPVVNRGPVSQPAGDTPPEPDVYYTDIEAAAAQMREQMVARQAQIVIGFEAERKSATLMDDIFAEAIAHTQVPDEGDYLRWNTMYWLSTRYTYDYGTYCSMIIVYEVYYYTTADQETEMDAAVDTLLNTLDLGTASDYKKVCGVYDWICENVVYDDENLEDDTYTLKQSSYAALVNGTSVCQGYATLLYRLLIELDVDCRVIVGDAGGSHAWNIVEMDGLYYNADSTWDASYAQAGWDYNYFLVSEAEFTDHVRDEEYLTEEFQTAYPMGEVPYDPITASGTWGDNVTWSLEDGVLTISGEGAMASENDPSYYPWYQFINQIFQVIIEPGVTDVQTYAFYGYPNLEKVVLGESVISLCDLAFAECLQLKEVILPSTLKTIGIGCFSWSGLEIIELPEDLEAIGDEAFMNSALTAISIPDTVMQVGSMVFSGCSDLVFAKLSGSCQTMREVFPDCENLETVIIPEGVEQLGTNMFLGCEKLNSVVLPDSLRKLGLSCFSGCIALTDIVIPANMESIGSGVFSDCSSLRMIRFEGNAPEFVPGVFATVVATVYYPAGNETWTADVMQQYGGTLNWVAYDAAGTCGDNLTWVLVDNVLTISGTGEMYDLNVKGGIPCPWLDYSETITKVIIEEGVTSIGAEAFRWHIAIEEIVIPDTVTAIGQSAIMGCINLKRLEIPAGVTEIGSFMATNCSSMTELVIPEGVTSLSRHAFSSCSSLEKVVIPSTVTWFDMSVFANCSALREVRFLGDAPEYLEMVFDGVTATVYYPADNETWTQEQINAYNNANEATLTWVPYGEVLENPFTDVTETWYYYNPVLWAYHEGITAGRTETEFMPADPCARDQVVTFLWRAAGRPEPNSLDHGFTDVVPGSFYEKAVAWAVENGITAGLTETTFGPHAPCTRDQVVTFLWRYFGKPEPSGENPFTDVAENKFYYRAVLWAYENGITAGKTETTFLPADTCTRGQVVTFLYRAMADQ